MERLSPRLHGLDSTSVPFLELRCRLYATPASQAQDKSELVGQGV
jgi:hypothetical protein